MEVLLRRRAWSAVTPRALVWTLPLVALACGGVASPATHAPAPTARASQPASPAPAASWSGELPTTGRAFLACAKAGVSPNVAQPKSVRDVDWCHYPIYPERECTLHRGTCDVDNGEEKGRFTASLGQVRYVDFGQQGVEEAIVIVDFQFPSASTGVIEQAELFVFALRGGQPQIRARGSVRFRGSVTSITGQQLVVTHPWDDERCTTRYHVEGASIVEDDGAPECPGTK